MNAPISSFSELALAEARDYWRERGVAFDDSAFHTYLEARPPKSMPNSRPHPDRILELYLVHGCLTGDKKALQHFDEYFLVHASHVLRRLGLGADAAADMVQELRIRLLSREPPLLENYRGDGPLLAWLRIILARSGQAWKKAQAKKGELALLGDEGIITRTPEIDQARAQGGGLLKLALHEAINALNDRDRKMLELNVLRGYSIDDLAKEMNVHRATAARHLAATRARLRKAVVARLKREIEGGTETAYELVAAVRSHMDLHLSAFFGDSS